MDQRKTEPFDQPGLDSVIAARSDVTGRLLHHCLERFALVCCGHFHVCHFPLLVIFLPLSLGYVVPTSMPAARRSGRTRLAARRWPLTVPRECFWRRQALRQKWPSA